MSKKYPKPALWFRLLLALICWGVVRLMVYLWLVRDIPERQMPDEHFAVCVMDGDYPRFTGFRTKTGGNIRCVMKPCSISMVVIVPILCVMVIRFMARSMRIFRATRESLFIVWTKGQPRLRLYRFGGNGQQR